MPIIRANDMELFYDEFGEKSAPVIVLIMGLGTQMIAWPEPFCKMLAERGFRILRFDNRDIGLSTKLDALEPADKAAAFGRAMMGLPVEAPYSLDDMADDTVALMDALNIAEAHIVGASMGGMIAQIVAARHGGRCRSLVSIMSTTGDPGLPPAQPDAAAALTAPAPLGEDRETCIQFGMQVQRAIGSPGYPASDTELRKRVEFSFDRSYYPDGSGRQLLAIMANGSRVDMLKTVAVPTLVLHGEADPLVPVACGHHTAEHIPGAVIKTFPGWGHDLPVALFPDIAGAIADHCRKADLGSRQTEAVAQPG